MIDYYKIRSRRSRVHFALCTVEMCGLNHHHRRKNVGVGSQDMTNRIDSHQTLSLKLRAETQFLK